MPTKKRTPTTGKAQAWWALGFILVISYFTYVHNFGNPPALFWDENYHIASAQKYLNGTFFMEPHPPLGKMLIALGEKVLDQNELDNQFIGTDYAQNPPAGFSFTGYRFFPVLLAWLTAPILFGIFLLLTRNTLWSTLLSFLYVFDNALIVHFRSAMLDGIMLFFSALVILSFLLLAENQGNKKRFTWASILFGASFAALLTTKAFGLLFILLIPFLFYILRRHLLLIWRFMWVGGLTFAVFFIGIWQLHFSITESVNPSLPNNGFYQASQEFRTIVAEGKNNSPLSFPIMLRDSLAFVSHYEQGVPRLDMCKADENGSPWFLWPFGGKTINYRWETTDGVAYRYLYLQGNPVVWVLGLMGVLFAFVLVTGSYLMPLEKRPRHLFTITIFSTLYVCYMIAISQIERVMYLYHYILPLFFSFILFGLVFLSVEYIGRLKMTDDRKTIGLLGLSVLMFVSYQFYRPLTYYEPIADKAFERRVLLDVWQLKCVRCNQFNPFAVPTK